MTIDLLSVLVLCDRCGSELKVRVAEGYGNTSLNVEPCDDCIKEAVEQAREQARETTG